MHSARLNAIARKIDAKRYLEVGVCDGSTFFSIDIEYKVAVDPRFLFDHRLKDTKQTVFHPVDSDAFFRATSESPFDLIFLDGLHTFHQTLRDFMCSMQVAHPKTVWLIDETIPNDCFSALPDQGRCYRLRNVSGSDDWSWMGDVYKTVFFIGAAMPFFDFRTFKGHGQTVVWRSDARLIERHVT